MSISFYFFVSLPSTCHDWAQSNWNFELALSRPRDSQKRLPYTATANSWGSSQQTNSFKPSSWDSVKIFVKVTSSNKTPCMYESKYIFSIAYLAECLNKRWHEKFKWFGHSAWHKTPSPNNRVNTEYLNYLTWSAAILTFCEVVRIRKLDNLTFCKVYT